MTLRGNGLAATIGINVILMGVGPTFAGEDRFDVYWNVPTFLCHKYGYDFEEASGRFGIRQNINDTFAGDQITILYDPGEFPALLKDGKGKTVKRNGGLPQHGDLEYHLEMLTRSFKAAIPDPSFSGVGVIDFERWRPVFRQNWASLDPYRKATLTEVGKAHPGYSRKRVERLAAETFENGARRFMESSLSLAKRLYPSARWGYYGYPYCYNESPQAMVPQCDPQTLVDNKGMRWFFEPQGVYLPSLYVRSGMTNRQLIGLVQGRVREARRMRQSTNPDATVLPYFWHMYQNNNSFLTRAEAEVLLNEITDECADGVILWGSSNDTKTERQCAQLHDYLVNTIGPLVSNLRKKDC